MREGESHGATGTGTEDVIKRYLVVISLNISETDSAFPQNLWLFLFVNTKRSPSTGTFREKPGTLTQIDYGSE